MGSCSPFNNIQIRLTDTPVRYTLIFKIENWNIQTSERRGYVYDLSPILSNKSELQYNVGLRRSGGYVDWITGSKTNTHTNSYIKKKKNTIKMKISVYQFLRKLG